MAGAQPGRVARGARRRAGLRRHARRVRAAPRLGAAALRRPLGRGVVARGARRPRRVAVGVAAVRGGVLPGRRAAAGHPERHLPARPEHLRVRHARAAGRHPAAAWPPPRTSGARAGPSPTPAATSPASPARRPAGRRRLGARRPEDLDHPGRVLHPPVRPVPHRPGQRSPQGPHLPPGARSTRRASPSAASAASTATRASPRCSSTTPSSPTTPSPVASCSGEPEGGWAVAMATAGSERGLTLRSPGRFLATAERLVALARRAGRRDACAGAPPTAWMHAEAYQQQTLATVTRLAERRQAGRRGEPHQALVVASSTSSCTRSPSTCSAPTPSSRGRGARAGSSPCRARSTPAPTRSSATSPPSASWGCPPMRFALSDDQVAFRDAVRRPAGQGVPRRPSCGPPGTRRRGRARPRGVGQPRRDGRAGVLVPEADGGLGLDETFLVPVLEEAGRVALPHPIVETAMVAAPLLGPSAGHGEHRPRRPARAVRGRRRPPAAARPGQRLVRRRPGRAARSTPVDDRRPRRRRGARVRHRPVPCDAVTDDPAAVELALDRGALGTAARARRPRPGDARPHRRLRQPSASSSACRSGRFQAVKHHLADAALALEFARPAVCARGLVRRPRRADPAPATSRWPRPWRPTPPSSSAARPSSATAPSATPSRPTCTST